MDYQLPVNYRLEDLALGTVLNSYAVLGDVFHLLEEDDFTFPANKWIFRAIASLTRKQKAIDIQSVFLELHETGKLADAGGQERLALLVQNPSHCFSSMEHLEKTIKSLQTYTLRRRFAIACRKAAEQACDKTVDIEPTIQETTEKCLELLKFFKQQQEGLELIADSMPKVLEDIEKLNSEEDDSILPSNLADLDKLVGGFQKGTLTVIAGRAGSGKTTVSLDLTATMASTGKKIAIFSLEMTKVQLIKKLMPRVSAGISTHPKLTTSHLFKSKGLSSLEDLGIFSKAMEDTSELSIWIDDYSSASASYVRSELASLINKAGCPDVVIIDYVGLMSSDNHHFNRVLEVDTILKDLRAMAKDLNVALIGLAQINRGVEQRNDKRPKLSDIRESGGYEQEAALVIGLYNEKVSEPDKEQTGSIDTLELIVLKNRFGNTGKVTVGFQPEYNRLINLT